MKTIKSEPPSGTARGLRQKKKRKDEKKKENEKKRKRERKKKKEIKRKKEIKKEQGSQIEGYKLCQTDVSVI